MQGAVLLLVGGVVVAAAAWGADRKRRAYTDQATTPAAAVFAGRNEVKGRAWSATPLTTFRSGAAAVYWRYVLDEERQHTRVVTTTDANGNTQTRTETYRQWHAIDKKGGALPVIEVVDESGSVPVQVRGAKLVYRTLYHEVFERDDGGGFLDKLFDNRTGRYQETELGIAVGDQLFVVGDAELDESTGVPVLGKDVLVSTKSEEHHSSMWSAGASGLALLAVMLNSAGWAWALSPEEPDRPLGWAIGVAVSVVALLIAWGITLYNRLHLLAQAGARAWSLIDVQLKRRHDLIPALANVVVAHAAHEASLLESLTSARAAGPDAARTAAGLAEEAAAQTGDLRQILGRAEAYPELTADQSFLRLQRELADTENRIAGSRTFYNDSLTLLRDKLEGFPGNLFARRLHLAGRELLPEAGFERTVPHLAPAFTSAAAAPRSS